MRLINSKPKSFLRRIYDVMFSIKDVRFQTNTDFLERGIIDNYDYEDDEYRYIVRATNHTLSMLVCTKDPLWPICIREIDCHIRDGRGISAIKALKKFVRESSAPKRRCSYDHNSKCKTIN